MKYLILAVIIANFSSIYSKENIIYGNCTPGSKNTYHHFLTLIDNDENSVWDSIRVKLCDGTLITKKLIIRDSVSIPEKCLYELRRIVNDSGKQALTFYLREYEGGPLSSVLEFPAHRDSCYLIRLVNYFSFKKKIIDIADKKEMDAKKTRMSIHCGFFREDSALYVEYYAENKEQTTVSIMTASDDLISSLKMTPFEKGWNVFRFPGQNLGLGLQYYINSSLDGGRLNVSVPFKIMK
ncbi:MAG: hypothetical protein QG635_2344 [Bacteroidota bacterium]|nr:hypothetical protein [Bacteroidota bacterium]